MLNKLLLGRVVGGAGTRRLRGASGGRAWLSGHSGAVGQLFDTMDYTTAPESPALAKAWIDSHGGKFGIFVSVACPAVYMRAVYAE